MKERLVHVKYRKNYLTQVIFQLRFAPLGELGSREMEEYGGKVKTFLPKVDVLQRMQFTATLSPQEPSSVKTEKQQPAWRFQSEDGSKTLTVAPEQFALEYSKYEDSDAMKHDIDVLWNPFLQVHPVEILKRVGLRYVNQIVLQTGSGLDWNGWLAEEIVASTLRFPAPVTIGLARSMHVAIWQGEDYGVRLQWGINNSDYPNAITKREFILDYDCFTVGDTEAGNATKLLDEYNKVIEDLFERSIEQKLRDEMGVI